MTATTPRRVAPDQNKPNTMDVKKVAAASKNEAEYQQQNFGRLQRRHDGGQQLNLDRMMWLSVACTVP